MSKRSQKTVVITGATRGLGLALAERLAEMGHTVICCGRSRDAVHKLRGIFGEKHDFAAVDVASEDQVKEWAERVLARFGPPDLLLNNAALINRNAPLWEVPAEDFDTLIDVNIKGVANVIRHFVPAMIARKTGVIVNFSSGWGRGTAAEVAPYCASKWAIEGLTRALALELPHGMAAIPLNPGIIDTDMLRSCFGESASSYPSPQKWSENAAPFLLGLGTKDNGKPLTVRP